MAALRLLAVYALVGALLYFAEPEPFGSWLGLAIVSTGEGLRLWASGHLLKNDELVTAGPYRYTRNPLYLGRLLIFSGLCLMTTLPSALNFAVLAAGWLIFFGYYLPRKERVEPARLRALHGARFDRYFEAVPALFPAARPFAERATARWRLERMLRNREHWMVVALAAGTLFLLWRAYSSPVS